MKDLLYPLRRLHGCIEKKKIEINKKFSYWKDINFPVGSKYFVVGTPTHTNIGDSAIVIAEQQFLYKCFGKKKYFKEFTVNEYLIYHSLISRFFSPHNHYFWHGGGNMGDQWFYEEEFRRKYIAEQMNCNPIILPQTIYYTDTESGLMKQSDSVKVYNTPALTIVARERRSYDIMKKLYPKAEIILTPDIVLSTTMETFGAVEQERKGVLFCTRSDGEKAVEDSVWAELEEIIKSMAITYRKIDMYSDCPVTKENRAECVSKKMQVFCGAELVITDRLHGMVFAAITGTPCIVFSNNNHKVKGTYDWISYLPYIRYVETVEQAKAALPEFLEMKECRFENEPLKPYFEKLAEAVKENTVKRR